jgi:peptide deformylase
VSEITVPSRSPSTSTRSESRARTRSKLSIVSEALEQLDDGEQPLADDEPAGEIELEELAGDEELDPEIAARRKAALAHVRKWGDPILKTKARPVDRFDGALREEIERMGVLMHDALGIGLAATQVGVLHRVLVYRVQSQAPVSALINPKLEWHSGEEEIAEEGCLSLPTVLVEVERPLHIRVAAQDPFGEPVLVEASGLEARVIQHEMDHLDGVLILNRTSREQRKEAAKALREWRDQAGAE